MNNESEKYFIVRNAGGTHYFVLDVAVNVYIKNRANGALYFYTNDTQRMAISSSGAVTLEVPLGVGSGGTGAQDAATARSNLGVDTPPVITATTITLAKLTTGGTNGSITVNASGRVTAYVQPT